MERGAYLDVFRRVVISSRERLKSPKDSFITHNYLALLEADEFDSVFSGIFANPEVLSALTPLKLVDCLPDRSHWERHLQEPDFERDWQGLALAITGCFDHQSEKSTDIRWMKVMHSLVCGRTKVVETIKDVIEEFRLYPDKGDMRAVRPSIRSFELALRQFEFGDWKSDQIELPPEHSIEFWSEMKTKTRCIMIEDFVPPSRAPKELSSEVISVFQACQNHFDDTIQTTAPDPRHDGAFGLAMYALSLLLNASVSISHGVVEGRLILRAIVEAFITLRYLAKNDKAGLWLQYRRYGSGQAKLAFLKNVRESEVPDFVDLALIERLANEDMWMEFHDIHVGNWASITLRKMAEDAGEKSVYDKFYDWASGYSHCHWISVRNTVFVNCVNSLHRFHRIPGPPIVSMPSVLSDACRLVNGILETLNALYPTFRPRLKWHKAAQGTLSSTE